jgi:Subtilase family/Secretion system C-terminal sorting domain
MKKIICFTLIFCCAFFTSKAQFNKMNVEFLKVIADKNNLSKTVRVLIKGNMDEITKHQQDYGIHVDYYYSNIAAVTAPPEQLIALAKKSFVTRIELPVNRHLRPLNDTMRFRNNINPVNAGAAPLNLPLNGQGVIIGMMDSGHDYRHPDFKDPQTGKSRIRYLWDQADTASQVTSPAPFNYGNEWDSTSFNNNSCTHTDVMFWGHGTHTAGIAGANGGVSGKFAGVAPEAEFISVALDFYSTGPVLSDAVHYIFTKAAALGKPCVINASVGDYYGSHDGKDLQSQLIDAMLQTPGRLMVGAAGNSAEYKYHVGYTVNADTNFTWIYNGNTSVNFQIYSDVNDFAQVKYAIGANASSFADAGRIGFKNFSSALNSIQLDTLLHNGNRIGIIQTIADTADGLYTLDVTIFIDSVNYKWRFEATGSGKFDSWNFDYLGSNLPSTSTLPAMQFYKAPDSLMTIVSGFQCLDNVITVGNYINMTSWYDVNNNLQTIPYVSGQISTTSSHGPTRDGRLKPDITASGDQILSTGVLSLLPSMIANNPSNVSSDSLHVMGGGTSSSSPVVAGFGALFLELNPSSTVSAFKQAITQCPRIDNFTGNNLPNEVWGYGKLDGFAAITCFTLHSNEVLAQQDYLFFPNPASDFISFSDFQQGESYTIEIFDAQGKLVVLYAESKEKIDIRGLTQGLYFIRVTQSKENKFYRGIFSKQ